MKRTSLYEEHIRLGGRMVEFAGWEMPVQYSGILEEHERVRTAAGLFDVSHMGEILVCGKQAAVFLQSMLTNDLARYRENQIMYTPMCLPDGGVLDDLLVYRLEEDE